MRQKLLAEGVVTTEIPATGEAWATTRLLARLGADAGSVITVGNTSFRITKVLDFPARSGLAVCRSGTDIADQFR